MLAASVLCNIVPRRLQRVAAAEERETTVAQKGCFRACRERASYSRAKFERFARTRVIDIADSRRMRENERERREREREREREGLAGSFHVYVSITHIVIERL